MLRVVLTLGAGGLIALASATPAYAHAELAISDPVAGSTVDAGPSSVRLDFSEGPSAASVLSVRDGCGADVTKDLAIDGSALVATLSAGHPGGWVAQGTVVSADDGHAESIAVEFTVAGDPACTAPVGATASTGAAPTTAGAAQQVTSGGSGTSSLVLLSGGALLIAGGTVLARRRTGGGH